MTKLIKNLDKKALGKIAYKNSTSEAVFTLVGTRERARGETDIRRLKSELINEGFQIIPNEFLQTFKDMAAMGIGELQQGSGKPPRWRWLFNQIEVAKIALANKPPEVQVEGAGLETLKQITKLHEKAAKMPSSRPIKTPSVKPVNKKLVAKTQEPMVHMVVALLDGGRRAKLETPANLTAVEARLLADTLLKSVVNQQLKIS